MTSSARSIVIKIGGRAQLDARLAPALAALWTAWQRTTGPAARADRAPVVCIVHGGGDEMSALQRAAGIEPVFVGGRRVTAPDDIDRLRMALSGVANKRLVAALGAVGVRAVGLSGEDGPLLLAEPLDDGRLGAVGAVCDVDTSLIALLVGAGYLPVVAPVAASYAARAIGRPRVASDVMSSAESGPTQSPWGRTAEGALNVNGDDAAAAVAAAVGASELLLVSDVAAVCIGGVPVTELTARAAERAIAAGEITGGMEAKVRAALGALDRGVALVRIGGLGMLGGHETGTVVIHAAAAGAPCQSTQQEVVAA